MLWLIAAEDIEAPPGPTREILTHLRAQGKPVEMVVFPETDHGITEFVQRADGRVTTKDAEGYFRTMLTWIRAQATRSFARRANTFGQTRLRQPEFVPDAEESRSPIGGDMCPFRMPWLHSKSRIRLSVVPLYECPTCHDRSPGNRVPKHDATVGRPGRRVI